MRTYYDDLGDQFCRRELFDQNTNRLNSLEAQFKMLKDKMDYEFGSETDSQANNSIPEVNLDEEGRKSRNSLRHVT